MAERPSLAELFGALHNSLEHELGIVRRTIGHAGTMGTVSEDRWLAMFREHLPKRYEINRAFVIDSHGQISDQIDIVIHDRQYSPFVLNLGTALYVPAESVYGVLEVKQSMSCSEIAYAGAKVASVRKLHRTSLPIKHAGGEYPAKPLHGILGGIVALESDWSPPFGDAFRASLSKLDESCRLDIGCAVRNGIFEQEDSSAEITDSLSDCALALFLMRLIARLQSLATVPCIDVLAYSAAVPRSPEPPAL